MIPDRIGMMGFSAGGHLTSTAGTHFDAGKADATDPIERVSSRPDFLILGYPVDLVRSRGRARGVGHAIFSATTLIRSSSRICRTTCA